MTGTPIMDMLTHNYDCARWFVGSEAKSVYGLCGAYVYEGPEAVNDIDNCAVMVEFENGVIGQIETSRNCPYGYHVETEMYGSDGYRAVEWAYAATEAVGDRTIVYL